ncbi:tRNA (guanosine(46)-N7)-methyltransferase TrmB [Aeromicrobium marinum]|uniref:tRNA (guanosine(46)-N7)-methyltransferase TrmB n=1 Tax=Aeromicrobium marinum TaxID=219314 RepID=UPI001FDF6967|nr:tRNA (guanosine(46)-N7)-methyltransferase TrmB [Aeromicrobium marinum]
MTSTDPPSRYRATPVSFTRRGGRLTERQQAAWDAVGEQFVLDLPRAGSSTSVDPGFVLDVEAVFGRRAPLVVEIGGGRGEVICGAAEERPEVDLLGLEVYRPGVAQTLVTLRHRGLTSVRLAMVDAAEALATMLPAGSVDELWVNFPDPWPKARHHKRRLVTPAFAGLAARVLRPGGVWRLATDWAEYAEQMAEVIAGSDDFDGGPAERFAGRALTRFEAKGVAAGRPITDLRAVRR